MSKGWNGQTCDCNGRSVEYKTLNDVVKYLKVDKIWEQGFKGKGIVVGIMDEGITAESRSDEINPNDKNHPDWPGKLIKNVIGGYRPDWGTTGIIERNDGRASWHGNMVATDVLGVASEAEIYERFLVLKMILKMNIYIEHSKPYNGQ